PWCSPVRGKGFSPKNPAFSASAERLYHRRGDSASGRAGKNADFWGFFDEVAIGGRGARCKLSEKNQERGGAVPGAAGCGNSPGRELAGLEGAQDTRAACSSARSTTRGAWSERRR